MLAALAVIIAAASAAPAQEPTITLPEGITCNDLFWRDRSRINPTELSDYQECILATHYGETDSGNLGDILWVRIEGEYFSVSKRELRAAFGTEKAAQEAFTIEIHRQYNEWKRGQ